MEKPYTYNRMVYGVREEMYFENLSDAIEKMVNDFWNGNCGNAVVFSEEEGIAYSIYEKDYLDNVIDGYKYVYIDDTNDLDKLQEKGLM